MKQIKLFGLLAIAAVLSFTSLYGADKKEPGPASLAPDFTLKDITGKQVVSLEKFRGKVILLNFWATWCPPCRMEIPDLIELQQTYRGRLVIIGVSVDQDKSAVPGFYRQNKMNYAVVNYTDELVNSYGGITGIPTSFIINTNGEIVTRIVGYRNKAGYEALVKPLFAK